MTISKYAKEINVAIKHGTQEIYWEKGNAEVKIEIKGKLNELLPENLSQDDWNKILQVAWIEAGVCR